MKKALITGASTGIGALFATTLQNQGWEVFGVARQEEKLKEQPAKYGFLLNEATKDMIISQLKAAWRPGQGGYIERSEVTMTEAAFFEIKEDGRLGAIEGEHDDSLISAAGSAWLANEYMRAPFYIDTDQIEVDEDYNEAFV